MPSFELYSFTIVKVGLEISFSSPIRKRHFRGSRCIFYEILVGITPYFTTRKEDIFHNIEHGELKILNFV